MRVIQRKRLLRYRLSCLTVFLKDTVFCFSSKSVNSPRFFVPSLHRSIAPSQINPRFHPPLVPSAQCPSWYGFPCCYSSPSSQPQAPKVCVFLGGSGCYRVQIRRRRDSNTRLHGAESRENTTCITRLLYSCKERTLRVPGACVFVKHRRVRRWT